MAVDANDDLYCIGSTDSFGAGNTDFALVKFASSRAKRWNITGGGTSIDNGYGVAVDASGAVYCVGDTDSFGGECALLKVAPNGTRLWNTTWGITYSHYCNGIAIDTSGALYCIGYTDNSGISWDFELVKFGYLSGPGGIPGFELMYLLIGLLALISLVQRKRSY